MNAYIVKTGGDKKVLVDVVSSTSPEVANLLRLNLGIDLKWWAVHRRGRDLENRQGRSIGRKRLRDSGNRRNQGRQTDPEGVSLANNLAAHGR